MPEIEIKLNQPRTELSKEGFRLFRYAPSIRLAKVGKPEDTEGGKTGIAGWIDSDDDKIWRNPATGALIVRPSGLRDDFFESALYSSARYVPGNWRYNTAEWQDINYSSYALQSGGLHAFAPKFPDEATELTPISVSTEMESWQSDTGSPIIWTHELNAALPHSAGFGIIVQPHGTALSKGSSLMAIGWGNKLVLEVGTTSKAKLFARVNSKWIQIAIFDYAAGGVKPGEAFQINILPNGNGLLTILFSNFSRTTDKTSAGKNLKSSSQHTIDLRPIFGDEIYFDETEGFVRSIPAGPIVIGCRRRTFRVMWSAYKNIYPTDVVTVTTRPEALVTKKEQGGLEVKGFGYESNTPYGDGKPRILTRGKSTDGTGEWTPDDLIVPVEIKFRASQDHSPELWGYRVSIPDETVVPTWTPLDVSAAFQKLTIKRSLDTDPQTADIQLYQPERLGGIYKTAGTIQIKAKDQIIWDGYVKQRRPTLIGGNSVIMVDRLQGVDMSTRLAESYAGFDSIAGLPIRTAIEQLFQAAGFPLEQIAFGDDDTWMDEDVIASPEGGDQDKMWSADTTVADALKHIAEMYGVQDRSLISYVWQPVEQRWFVSTKAKYDPETPPEMRFWATPAIGTFTDEQDRWDQKQFHVLEQVEFTTYPSPFNAVRVQYGKSTSEDSTGNAVHIGINPASINTPTSSNFVGRVIQHKADAPKQMAITTKAEAERYARLILDQFGKTTVGLTFTGEWQPGVDVGQEFALIGKIEDESGFVTSSFGAFRITEIEITVEHDHDGADFSWRADYTAEYLGEAAYPEEGIESFRVGWVGGA